MRDALLRLLEPPVEALGYELVDVEFPQAGRGGLLRLFIEIAASTMRREASRWMIARV